MAEDDKEELEIPELDGEDEEGTKGKKGLIFIIVGVVALLAIGAGAYFFLMGSDEPAEGEVVLAEGEIAEGEAGAEDTGATNIPVFYDLPEFLVDLNTSGRGKASFLKMLVTVELSSEEDVQTMETMMPRVRDTFITYLRELRASDLSGSAGLYRLREELLLRLNQSIAPVKVNNILFKEVIVQ